MTRVLAAAALFVLLVSGPAGAHGELEKTQPAEGAVLKQPPGHVTITLTEAPAEGAVLRVVDGCKNNLVPEPLISERSLHSPLDDGQPGRWKVSYRVVSAEDGHLTKGSYTFQVKGNKDCSADEPEADTGDEVGPASTPITAEDTGSDDGGFPILPVGLGAAVVLVAAIAIRVTSDRSS
jgi:copper resistance protein C